MKVQNSELTNLIKEILNQILSEQNFSSSVPQTRSSISDVPPQETPKEKQKRLRQQFKHRPTSTTIDPNTQDGRENIVNIVSPFLGNVQTRLQIIEKMSLNAGQAESRQQFKEFLIQIFENLKSLQETDMVKLVESYSKLSTTIGLKTPQVTKEQNLNPDTPDGRKNLVKNIHISIAEMRKIAEEGRKMLNTAQTVPTVSVFLNELRALGQKIAQLRNYIVTVNSVFVKTFQEYEKQRGRNT